MEVGRTEGVTIKAEKLREAGLEIGDQIVADVIDDEEIVIKS